MLLPLLPEDVQKEFAEGWRGKLEEVYANKDSAEGFSRALKKYVSLRYKLPTEDRIKIINTAWQLATKEGAGLAEQADALGSVTMVMPKREDLRGKFENISWTQLREMLVDSHFVDVEKGTFHADGSRVRGAHLKALLMFIKRVNWYINAPGDRSVVEEVVKSSAVLLKDSSTDKEKMLAQAMLELFARPYGATQGMCEWVLFLLGVVAESWLCDGGVNEEDFGGYI